MQAKFVDYLKDPEVSILSHFFNGLMLKYQIRPHDWECIEAFLAPLRTKGEPYLMTFEHSVRVALLGTKVAEFMHVDPKVMVFAGLLHDIGKIQVPAETLGKTDNWTQKDTELMKPHVMRSYEIVRDRFDFSGEVILWHHRFQAHAYPRGLPKPTHNFCAGTKVMIPFYGRLLSLCDQFDAFHRVNGKNGVAQIPTGEGIKELMLKFNGDQRLLIEGLYAADIFTTFTAPLQELDVQTSS